MTKIKQEVNPIDFVHISSMLVIYNDKNIRKCKEVQNRKNVKLSKGYLVRNQPNKVIYNISFVNISVREK